MAMLKILVLFITVTTVLASVVTQEENPRNLTADVECLIDELDTCDDDHSCGDTQECEDVRETYDCYKKSKNNEGVDIKDCFPSSCETETTLCVDVCHDCVHPKCEEEHHTDEAKDD